MSNMNGSKKSNRKRNFTVEEIYQNKNFKLPKEQNLETIFEEPRESKNGAQIFTSNKKYRRYLDFDPTRGKILKRKKNAKKCATKISKRGKTRSATKSAQMEDISAFLNGLSDSSDESMMDTSTMSNFDCADDTIDIADDKTNLSDVKSYQMVDNIESSFTQKDIKISVCREKKVVENVNIKEKTLENADDITIVNDSNTVKDINDVNITFRLKKAVVRLDRSEFDKINSGNYNSVNNVMCCDCLLTCTCQFNPSAKNESTNDNTIESLS